MNKKGVALILGLAILGILLVLGSAVFTHALSERTIAQKYMQATQAFWLAEAGVNKALDALRANYNSSNIANTALGAGGYRVDITSNIDASRTVTAYGFIPFSGTMQTERSVTAKMNRYTPSSFYDNAIYSGGTVTFNGNNFSVRNNELAPDNKAVLYANSFNVQQPGNIAGTSTQDTSISPLARLDFPWLLSKSQQQGYVYSMQGNQLINEQTGQQGGYPAQFFNAVTGEPNIVYIKGDLTLNGNIGTIGGFFVVVGDVVTNPNAVYDTTINGNGQVDGLIYTRGEFIINGGGQGLNVNGGVWAGQEVTLNGSATVTYNKTYMDAVDALNIDNQVQILSWKDNQNPYTLQ